MRSLALTVIGALVGVTVLSTAGHAAVISGRYTFSATSFTSGSPVDPVTGTIAISFDNSQLASNQSTGISLVSSNITLGSQLQYNYLLGTDILQIGGAASGVVTTDTSTNDFSMVIFNATSSVPFITSFSYSSAGTLYTATRESVSFAASAVPEPISITLLGSALVGMVGARRFGKSSVQA